MKREQFKYAFKDNKVYAGTNYAYFTDKPLGIQVSRIESLRFLLLNAVIIPMTKKNLRRSFNCSGPDSVLTCNPSSLSALAALAAASCISKEEMVLSNVL